MSVVTNRTIECDVELQISVRQYGHIYSRSM